MIEGVGSFASTIMENCDFIPYDLYKEGVKSNFWSKMPLAIHDTMACAGESSGYRIGMNLLEEERLLNSIPQHERVDLFCRSSGSFLPELGDDLVQTKLWLKLTDGSTKVANFQTCCLIRCVCFGWKTYVEDRAEWQKGVLSWSAWDHRSWQELPADYMERLQTTVENNSAQSGDSTDEESDIAAFSDEGEVESLPSENGTSDT
ncbi:hypothetical protein KC19_VG257000 [Ceratodon purpureus]|uniref:Uncharacterized protein n=1 Tax=Ceratodon purpureus TaxID=3225 RepID=A0A8T0HTI9_CERPU|nr:hypothetical protein KC19_VG257000 [Ceratodon purpureus]